MSQLMLKLKYHDMMDIQMNRDAGSSRNKDNAAGPKGVEEEHGAVRRAERCDPNDADVTQTCSCVCRRR